MKQTFFYFTCFHFCPETKARSRRGYQPHGCSTPTLMLSKTQRDAHTILPRQASLSSVLGWIPGHIPSFSCSVVSVRLFAPRSYYLLCMLCKVRPRILCHVLFLSAIALVCLCQCRLLIMLSARDDLQNFHIEILFTCCYLCSVRIAVSAVHCYILSVSINLHIYMLQCVPYYTW